MAARAAGSALLMTPRLGFGPPTGFEPAPTGSRFAVTGTRYRSRTEPGTALVLAADGVSVVRADGPCTVLFDECVALLRFPDGARHLLGVDGVAVAVEPTLYPLPGDVRSRLDAAVPRAVHVDLPPRDPERVPRRAWTHGLRARASATALSLRMRLDRHRLLHGGIGTVLVTGTLLLAGVVSTVLAAAHPTGPIRWVAVAVLASLLWRRRTRGRW